MTKKTVNLSLPDGPRDGLDNTGTQGADSLRDDAYTGDSKKAKARGDDEINKEEKSTKLADQPGDRENAEGDDAMNYKSDREQGAYNPKNI